MQQNHNCANPLNAEVISNTNDIGTLSLTVRFGTARSHPRCTKRKRPPGKGQYTNHHSASRDGSRIWKGGSLGDPGDGSPPLGSRGKAPVGSLWRTVSQKLVIVCKLWACQFTQSISIADDCLHTSAAVGWQRYYLTLAALIVCKQT